MGKQALKLITTSFFFLFSLIPTLVFAQDTVNLNNPLGNTQPASLIGQIISSVLGIVGSLALVMFIYGGLIWMTAAGNSEQISKGRNILIWATIGLVVIFSSYALVHFVFSKVLGGV